MESYFSQFLGKFQLNADEFSNFKRILLKRYMERKHEYAIAYDRLSKQLFDLNEEKQRIIDLAKDGVLDREDSKSEIEKVKTKILEVELELQKTKGHPEEVRMELLLEHAEKFFQTLPTWWIKAKPQAKVKLQRILFPNGLIFAEKDFSNTKLRPSIKLIEASKGESLSLVTPSEFESLFQG